MIELPAYLAYFKPHKFTKESILNQCFGFISIADQSTDSKKWVIENRGVSEDSDPVQLIQLIHTVLDKLKSIKFDRILWRQVKALNEYYKINLSNYQERIQEFEEQLIEYPELTTNLSLHEESAQANFEYRCKVFQSALQGELMRLESSINAHNLDSAHCEEFDAFIVSATSSSQELTPFEIDSQQDAQTLAYVLQLLGDYLNELKKEQKSWTYKINFFHQARKDHKIAYCDAMLEILKQESDKPVPERIKAAHEQAILNKKGLDLGGSYLGTSRLLGIQRLLGIDSAWTKGHSSFFGIKTRSDFHGLKSIGVRGETCKTAVEKFYSEDMQEIMGVNINRVVRG